MPGRPVYTREELARLRASARSGKALTCPRCQETLLSRPVRGGPEVPYVRSRTWWICPGCRRSLVLDRERSGGDAEGA